MIGKTISHYKILEKLGSGGMGVVYKALDTKLDRFVALKFLPTHLSEDETEKLRFIHEAKAASALDHPNICTIYEIGETDDGQLFICMAYYEGETLKERIAKGDGRREMSDGRKEKDEDFAAPFAHRSSPFAMTSGLPVAETIELATQIANGLAKAHEHGITHRDIKPANVMITKDGVVKILDFGLAKLAGRAKLTKTGSTMGTAAYMSPEQAQRMETDHRTDVWSLGVVMYEMLTGRLPFEGEYEQAIMYAIVNMEPEPVRSLESEVPVELENMINKCLAKEPAERCQTVLELQADLQRIEDEGDWKPQRAKRKTIASTKGLRSKSRAVWSIALLTFVLIGVILIYVFKPFSKRSSQPLVSIPLTHFPGLEMYPAFSPDGKQIAFSFWRPGESYDIYVKLIGAGEPLRLTHHPGVEFSPVWSPDGRHLAFIRLFEDKYSIHLIPALGGVERQLQSVNLDQLWTFYNISWSPDGKFLAIPHRESSQEPVSLYLLSLESLEKYKLTTPPALYHGDLYSAFSPDGKKLAFIRERSLYVNSIHIVPITGGESQPLYDEKHSISGLAWTRDGREIVFCGMFVGVGKGLEGLWRLAAAGGRPELVPLVAGADYVSKPTISRQGELLAYEQGKSDENIWRLDLPTVKGQSAAPYAVISSSRLDWFPNISPDGSRIVFVSNRSGSGQIWMCDSSGHDAVQLTSLTADAGSPRWSPDRQHIAFDSRPEGHSDIFMLNVDGGNPQRVTTAASDDITPSWSRDGRWIYFASNRSGNFEIWRSPVQGGDAVRITTGADGISPFESFDGKWIYYAKQEKSGIWRAPIQGGQDSLVLKFPPAGWWMPWALSVDGIYYINYRAKPGVIEFFSFATSHVTRIAELPQSLSCLAVSPDQRWLLYSQREIDTDIMLVENFR